MRKLLLVLGIMCSLGCNSQKQQPSGQTSVLDLVDPNIGTAHSRWFFYTPAAVPFGMAKLAPSTNGSFGNVHGWDATGYDPRHESIEGFANLHEFQIGGFLFTAITGDLKTVPGELEDPDSGYRSRYDKKDVVAKPGYYSVLLKDYNVKAELTATSRVGFQKYTFPSSNKSYIIFDIGNELGESGDVKDAFVEYNQENNTVEGWVITYPKYVQRYQPEGEIKMFFSSILDKKPMESETFKKDSIFSDSKIKGKGSGLFLKFPTEEGEEIEVKSGFSYTSVENARLNLKAEAEDMDFDQAYQQSQDIWSEELNKIKITDDSEKNKTKFYTALFHALLGRGLASDVNGNFPQNDGSTGQIPIDEDGKPEFNFYNTDSVWGAFWNLTQLWSLVWPEYYEDFVKTHLEVYKNSGWLGDGLANSKFVSGVGTNFVGLVIASAYQAGIRDFDVELAFQAAYENEVKYKDRNLGSGKTDLETFINNGYVTYTDGMETTPAGSGFSASHTLEYSFSSYAVAQFAKGLGKEAEYEELLELSDNWKNLYDEETDFIRPRDENGDFLEEFDPFEPWVGFQEGNAWQYTFYVPHQPEELISKMGEEKFISRLDSIFTVSEKTKFGGEDIDAFAGLEYLYNHGNQPSLHIPYLFNFTNSPWYSQKWVRRISDTFYGNEEVHGYGFGQDEDQGQLGAWYVMASLGLFDVKGLVETEPSFQFTSPIFDEIEITTGWGNKVRISTKNNASKNYFIQSLKVNGEEYHDDSIPLKRLKDNIDLQFNLGSEPAKSWGN